MRSTWFGASAGASSAMTRPWLVSITSTFCGSGVRQSEVWAAAGRAQTSAIAAIRAAFLIGSLVIGGGPAREPGLVELQDFDRFMARARGMVADRHPAG